MDLEKIIIAIYGRKGVQTDMPFDSDDEKVHLTIAVRCRVYRGRAGKGPTQRRTGSRLSKAAMLVEVGRSDVRNGQQ